ncbi:MAG: hypothetical protein PHW13_01185 [Methylococcales bacterium]|nr:hypothetical protein [Methylococcales bacterium]
MALNNSITLAKGADSITAGSKYKINGVSTTIDTATDYIVNGDSNADTINFAKSTGQNKLYGGSGNDKIIGSTVGNNFLYSASASGTPTDGIYTQKGGNNTLIGGNGDDNLTVNGTGNNVLKDGNGNDNIYIMAAGNDTVTVGTGTDLLYIGGGSTTTITSIGQGVDTLYVAGGGTVAKINVASTGFVAASGSENLGTAIITTHGHLVDLSNVTAGHGFTIIDTTGHTTLTGSAGGSTTIIGANGDTINGGGGSGNSITVRGSETLTHLNNGDNLTIAGGATATATIISAYTATSSNLANNGKAIINANGYSVDVSAMTKGKYILQDTVGGATLTGSATLADTISGGGSGDQLIGGAGADTFIAAAGADSITGLGDGKDVLSVAAGASATATIYSSGWKATSASMNMGTATLDTSGYMVNLSAIHKGNGYTIDDSVGNTTLIGTASASDTIMGATGDTITGGNGGDTYKIMTGVETITDLGKGADVLQVSSGATVNATIVSAWTATSATDNAGTAMLTTKGHAVDLHAVASGNGFTITNTGGSAKLTGTATGNDTFYAGHGHDTIVAGAGNDTIYSGKGGDNLTAGSGVDTFVYAAGDSKASNMDSIMGFKVAASGGDVIDYSSALVIGGSSSAATKTDASINATTGVASFAGTVNNVHQALVQIVNSLVHNGGDTAGDFAFFQVKGTGDEYLFISDGHNKAGSVDANSTVIHLVGVTSIGGISDVSGHLSITS